MSGLFGGGGGGSPPPPLPPPPPTPVMPDPQSPQVLEAQQVQIADAQRRSGRRSTILDQTVTPSVATAPYTSAALGAGAGR